MQYIDEELDTYQKKIKEVKKKIETATTRINQKYHENNVDNIVFYKRRL